VILNGNNGAVTILKCINQSHLATVTIKLCVALNEQIAMKTKLQNKNSSSTLGKMHVLIAEVCFDKTQELFQ